MTRTALPEDLGEVARLLGTEDLSGAGEVVVAVVLGEVKGLAVLEWLHPLQSPRAEAWLTALVTDGHARHRGIARTLLEEILRRVRQAGGDRLRIGCPLERDELRTFFAAVGFEPRLLVYERPT